jgi:site-specific DNA recombinase
MFERYLALSSLPALQTELRQRGVLTRQRTLSTGRTIGGIAFTNGPLLHTLRNRVYLGEINHREMSYPGEHAPILSAETFEAVQTRLATNRNGRRSQQQASGALLMGKIFDDRGNRMSPSSAQKGSVRYRYYISSVLVQGRAADAGSVKRVSAHEIESFVTASLRQKFGSDLDDRALIEQHLNRLVVTPERLELTCTDETIIQVPWSPQPHSARREIFAPTGADAVRPMKAEARSYLLRQVAQGRRWLDQIVRGSVTGQAEIAKRENCSKRHVERTIATAFLSPQIVKAAADGTLPRGANAKALTDAPMEWSQQWRMLGLG